MVRDLFEAEEMARVMSLVFMTFMLVPVLAPNVGQLILLFAPWRAIFIVLAIYAAGMLIWPWLRLPETLHPEFRRPLDLRAMGSAMLETAARAAVARLHARHDGQLLGARRLYFARSSRSCSTSFHAGQFIGLVFGCIAAPMALASWLNSRVVGRFGLRRVGHGGALAFLVVTRSMPRLR